MSRVKRSVQCDAAEITGQISCPMFLEEISFSLSMMFGTSTGDEACNLPGCVSRTALSYGLQAEASLSKCVPASLATLERGTLSKVEESVMVP